MLRRFIQVNVRPYQARCLWGLAITCALLNRCISCPGEEGFQLWQDWHFFYAPMVSAPEPYRRAEHKNIVEQGQRQTLTLEQRAKINYDSYILGPGDGLEIELLDLPELSGRFSIGPDGSLYLPRLRALYVEGLTIEELRGFLTQQFKAYVRDPQVYVRPVAYRPIRIYVGGEVKRPWLLHAYRRLSSSSDLSRRRRIFWSN